LQAQAESDKHLQTATAQLEQTRQAAEAQLAEAQRLRREQIQPYVAVFTESSGNHPAQVDLVVKNFGMTPAREIHIEFSPRPRSANLRNSNVEEYFRVPDVIALLVPSQEWRTYWDWGAALKEAEDLPRRYEVKVTYSDQHGNKIARLRVRDRLGSFVRSVTDRRQQPTRRRWRAHGHSRRDQERDCRRICNRSEFRRRGTAEAVRAE
jgi:hypothetical protein